MAAIEPTVNRVLEWAVRVDAGAVKGSVEDLRRKHPNASSNQLASAVFGRAAWKATATGVIAGLPANLVVSVPAALLDAGIVLRTELTAAAKVAVIYEPDFFDDEDANWELLVPIFGMNVASQFLQRVGISGSQQVTKRLIKKYLSKETLKAFKRVMLRYFGIKVTQRALISKTVPVVGGIIGGAWNQVEVRIVGRRVVRYFEKGSLGAPVGAAA